MVMDDLHDAALVLVGHGSTLNAYSAAPTIQHAEALRRRGIFAEVREAFWKQAPYLRDVIGTIKAERIFVVPLFITEGYFTEEIIPRELGLCGDGEKVSCRRKTRGGQLLVYCRPVGTHERMTDVLLARARDVVEKHPFPCALPPQEIALFIAGHGTGRNENSRKTVERAAELIRSRNLYAETYAVFMEEEPGIGDCYKIANSKNIVMVPFFISDGLHSYEDIPMLLGEPEKAVRERLQQGLPTWRNPTERNGKRVWYASALGAEPLLGEVILERVREAAAE
jgi:sirohydrochlorin cobaltochelatase